MMSATARIGPRRGNGMDARIHAMITVDQRSFRAPRSKLRSNSPRRRMDQIAIHKLVAHAAISIALDVNCRNIGCMAVKLVTVL